MTRRVIKFPEGQTGRLPFNGARDHLFYPGGIKYPPYRPGDTLYVRETWAKITTFTVGKSAVEMSCRYIYRADWDDGAKQTLWHPSIHMPREAARLFLRVTDVHVERLQNIAEEDAMLEGIERRSVPVINVIRNLFLSETTLGKC